MRLAIGFAALVAVPLLATACSAILGGRDVPVPVDGGSDATNDASNRPDARKDEPDSSDSATADDATIRPDVSCTSNGDSSPPLGDGSQTPCGEIAPGQELTAGESDPSCDDRFLLTMQSDGNLVLFFQKQPLWSSDTMGAPGARAVMQYDGNFVVYDSSGAGLWSTGTFGYPGALARVQDDGNFVVGCGDTSLWASNTCRH